MAWTQRSCAPSLFAAIAIAAVGVSVALAQDSGQQGEADESAITAAAGSDEDSTLPTLNRRSIADALSQAEFRALIPGCRQTEPGIFACGSRTEYQHCRTLILGQLVYSCEADLALGGGFANPTAAAADEYSLTIDSDARIRVDRSYRGGGRVRGEAEIALFFELPEVQGAQCLAQDSLIYYPTGPMGGLSEIGETLECGELIELSFEPHEDDVYRAWELCEAFAAWGSAIDDSFGVLVAGLFHMRSDDADFIERFGGDTAIIAPSVEVEAGLGIECRDR